MNTPRKIKRNTRNAARYEALGNPTIPYGRFERRISDPKFSAALGELVVVWPNVEDAMAVAFKYLLGGASNDVAEEIFHSIQTNSARVKLMRALLEKPAANSKLPYKFDAMVDEFSRLAEQRNRYVHAIWTTHESGAVICSPQREDPQPHLFGKEVKLAELQKFLEDCERLKADAAFFQPLPVFAHP